MSSSKIGLLVMLATLSFSIFARTPEGIWAARSPTYGNKTIGKVKVSIVKGTLQGELIEIFPLNRDGAKLCMRSKPIHEGPIIMCDYREEGGKWVGGKIYESSTGKVYKSEVRLSPEGNHLLVKGTSGAFSDTVVWDRLNR